MTGWRDAKTGDEVATEEASYEKVARLGWRWDGRVEIPEQQGYLPTYLLPFSEWWWGGYESPLRIGCQPGAATPTLKFT